MTRRTTIPLLLVRTVLAVALALSWLLLAGTPAQALVTNAQVQSPKAGAVLKKAAPLEIVVDRTAAPAEETITVETDLYFAGNQQTPAPGATESPTEGGDGADGEPTPAQPKKLNKKPLELPLLGTSEDQTRWTFGTTIDPYRLVWAGNVVAPNGHYILRYRTISTFGDSSDSREWPQYEFRLDAAPPPTSAPGVAVADAAAKRMSVAWQAHPVPDLSHYTVERRRDGGDWQVAAAEVAPDTTQIDDTVAKYGTYRYRVTAVRPAGDGSDETRSAVSPPSGALELAPPEAPAPRGGDDGDGTGTGDGDGDGSDTSGTSAPPPLPSSGTTNPNPSLSSQDESTSPDVAFPRGFDDTYKGPLDYGVEQKEVTERVPVDVAQGGAGDDSTLKVLDRAIDQSRVLPPVAGGLILVVSAAHVLRYLNE